MHLRSPNYSCTQLLETRAQRALHSCNEASRQHAAVRMRRAKRCGANATRRDGLERVRADSKPYPQRSESVTTFHVIHGSIAPRPAHSSLPYDVKVRSHVSFLNTQVSSIMSGVVGMRVAHLIYKRMRMSMSNCPCSCAYACVHAEVHAHMCMCMCICASVHVCVAAQSMHA